MTSLIMLLRVLIVISKQILASKGLTPSLPLLANLPIFLSRSALGYTIKPWNLTNIIVSRVLQRHYQPVFLIPKNYQNKSF